MSPWESQVYDLNQYISGYFDTSIGCKYEVDSYKKLADEIGHYPKDILFLSDEVSAVEKACKAGMEVKVVEREGYMRVCHDYNTIESLYDLLGDIK